MIPNGRMLPVAIFFIKDYTFLDDRIISNELLTAFLSSDT
jgi:hypothetical protein